MPLIIVKATVMAGVLPAAGQRAGADSGDLQLDLQMLAPEAKGSTGIWEYQPGGWPAVNRADTSSPISFRDGKRCPTTQLAP